MLNFQTPPNDSRAFFHKKLLGLGKFALTTFVPGSRTALDVIGAVAGGGGKKGQKMAARFAKFGDLGATTGSFTGKTLTQLRSLVTRGVSATTRSQASAELAARTGQPVSSSFAGIDCIPPFRLDPITNRCKLFLGDQPGPNGGGAPAQPGVPGGPPQKHLVLTPDVTSATRLRCRAGYVLGRDNLCYFGLPRNSKWRKWRPGRKPKFTGGDLNAIARTASLADLAEELFKDTNPAKKSVARSYRANWRKPLKK